MKKTALIITLLLIVVVNNVSAQITIGPKVGLNMSKEYFGVKAFNETVDFKAGINVGAFGKYKINDNFDVQTELLYSQQGHKSNIPLIDLSGTPIVNGYTILSHYLNVPLLLKYNPINCLSIEIGPQAGFLLDSKISPDDYADIDLDYNTVDFSLVGGVGLNIGHGLSVNARYNHGFTETFSMTKGKNRVFQFSLTYDLLNF